MDHAPLCVNNKNPNQLIPFICHECGKELAQINGLVLGVYPNFIHLNDSACRFNLNGPPKEPAMPLPVATTTLTKDDASDIRSAHSRVIETELDLARANRANVQAKSDLDSLLHRLQFPKQGA